MTKTHADFTSENRKATSSVTRTGGFNTGVQSQQFGLEGDVFDHLGDPGNLLRGLLQFTHC